MSDKYIEILEDTNNTFFVVCRPLGLGICGKTKREAIERLVEAFSMLAHYVLEKEQKENPELPEGE